MEVLAEIRANRIYVISLPVFYKLLLQALNVIVCAVCLPFNFKYHLFYLGYYRTNNEVVSFNIEKSLFSQAFHEILEIILIIE
jgi:hypothetical protein